MNWVVLLDDITELWCDTNKSQNENLLIKFYWLLSYLFKAGKKSRVISNSKSMYKYAEEECLLML